jgi:hypothetical protein
MSGAKSNVLKNLVVNHLFGGVLQVPVPTQWWIGIYSSNPTEAFTLSAPARITTLVRLTSPTSGPIWSINSNEVSNVNAIDFPAVPLGETWNVSHFAIFDSNTSGRPLYYGAFKTVKTLESGDILNIPAGKIIIREF